MVMVSFYSCEKNEIKPEETWDIYYVKFNNENAYLKDTVAEYDFNGDGLNDFKLNLTWQVDSTSFDVRVKTDYFKQIINSQSAYSCWLEDKGLDSDTLVLFQIGDSISAIDFEDRGISVMSGGGLHSFGQNANYNWIEEAKATKTYWALCLAVGNKVHYGWASVSCEIIDEIGFNNTPNLAIAVGQKE